MLKLETILGGVVWTGLTQAHSGAYCTSHLGVSHQKMIQSCFKIKLIWHCRLLLRIFFRFITMFNIFLIYIIKSAQPRSEAKTCIRVFGFFSESELCFASGWRICEFLQDFITCQLIFCNSPIYTFFPFERKKVIPFQKNHRAACTSTIKIVQKCIGMVYTLLYF